MSQKRMRSVAVALCALVLGASLIAGAVPASAHEDSTETARSKVSMVYKARKAKFKGLVTSSRDRCVGGRTVKLFKARNNALVGKTTTSASGSWAIRAKKNTGKYYSKVIAADYTLESGSDAYGNVWVHELLCFGAKSLTVTSNT